MIAALLGVLARGLQRHVTSNQQCRLLRGADLVSVRPGPRNLQLNRVTLEL